MARLKYSDFINFEEYKLEYVNRKNIKYVDLGTRMNLVGDTYGLLEVKEYIGTDPQCIAHYICKCECGQYLIIPHNHLRSGHTSSCGCEMKRINAQMRRNETFHGMWKSRIYNIHAKMISRCYNKKSVSYPNYGGRGIYICDEWMERDASGHRIGFINFYNWAIKNGYTDDLSIDRIDVDGPYCPENCRWVDPKVQNNNRRNTVFLEYRGYNFPISIWSEITGLEYQIIEKRLSSGWPIEKCLRVPLYGKKWDDSYLSWEVDQKYMIYHKPVKEGDNSGTNS